MSKDTRQNSDLKQDSLGRDSSYLIQDYSETETLSTISSGKRSDLTFLNISDITSQMEEPVVFQDESNESERKKEAVLKNDILLKDESKVFNDAKVLNEAKVFNEVFSNEPTVFKNEAIAINETQYKCDNRLNLGVSENYLATGGDKNLIEFSPIQESNEMVVDEGSIYENCKTLSESTTNEDQKMCEVIEDDPSIYQQVKYFRKSIHEINSLLDLEKTTAEKEVSKLF